MVAAHLHIDPTANWTDYVQKNSGTTVLDQQRDHNMVNEIDTDEVHGDADNPITENPGTAWADPVYDAAGNMTTAPWPSSLTTGLSCKYDAWNRLVEVKNGETVYAAHEYDGLNRRTIEIPGLGSTYYMHKYWNSSWQMLEQRQNTNDAAPESSGVARQCIWSPRYIDALVLENLWGTRRYFLGDANFNVTSVINTSGDAYEHYQYDPYGKVTILNGGSPDSDGDEWTADPGNLTDISNHYRYTGRWQDFKTLFYYYRWRYYIAELGRFISRDPIGYGAGDPNLYRYVRNRASNGVDPFGLQVRTPGRRGPVYGPSPYPPGPVPPPVSPPMHGKNLVLMPDGSVRLVVGTPDNPLDPNVAEHYQDTATFIHGPMPEPDLPDPEWDKMAKAACDKYDKFKNSRCCDNAGEYVIDPYVGKAKTVCQGFMEMYHGWDSALCVAECLTDYEVETTKLNRCAARNANRLEDHVICYAKCLFVPTKGLPEGGPTVGAGMLFPDYITETLKTIAHLFGPSTSTPSF